MQRGKKRGSPQKEERGARCLKVKRGLSKKRERGAHQRKKKSEICREGRNGGRVHQCHTKETT